MGRKYIAVIDYEMGNLRSVHKGLEKIGASAIVSHDPSSIRNAHGVVLPGVGSFIDCIRNLDRYNVIDPLLASIRIGKPFLGICLGLQVLFTESEEFGRHPGLNVLPGRVLRFPLQQSPDLRLKVPHMGWNQVRIHRRPPALATIRDGSFFYFVHSYYVVPDSPELAATTTEYGIEFVSSIWKENVFASQFHPEKSQSLGLEVLRQFKRMVEEE